MNNKTLISLLLILVCLVWAGSFVVVSITVQDVSPIDLGFLRFLVATPIMLLVLFLRKKKVHMPVRELPSLVFSFKKTAGIVLSFSGVAVVIGAQMMNENMVFSNVFFIGCLLVLLSAFCWAIYSIVGKRLLAKYDPFTITLYAFVLGTLFFLPVVLPNIFTVVPKISFNSWMAVLYLAVLCSVFGYVAWYYALSKIEASKAAVFLNLIPLFAITMSFFITNEVPTVLFLIGAILIIYGIYLAQ